MFTNRKNVLIVAANAILTLLLFVYLMRMERFDNYFLVVMVWVVNNAVLWLIVAYDATSEDEEEHS
ncbi:MAG: hypothetical protein AAF787_11460 [Chloroflexota bacterium]